MVLGVIGKIASGKSEVLKILKKMGFYCVDADKIVHALYENGGEGQLLIKKYFGKQYLLPDGSVDRKKLGRLIVSKKSKLLLLNKIIHPCVQKEMEKKINMWKTKSKNIAIEAVYFDKQSLGGLIDKVLLVKRNLRNIRNTLINERGMIKNIAEKMICILKIPRNVDFVIKNDGTLLSLEKELRKIL
jgi:dephospho-CoA kinase